jgi:predicted porin
MNKKIMAVAVAGALAAPGLALAQASVTITGFVKVSVGQTNNSNSAEFRNTTAGTANTPRLNTSEWGMRDDGPTRITFEARDQIDNDLTGVARIELRPVTDGNLNFGSSAGNQWIGMESKNYGTLRLGSVDQHYTLGVDTGATYAPTQVASGLMGYVTTAAPSAVARTAVAGNSVGLPAATAVTGQNNGGTQSSIAGASRTRNLIRWDSKDMGGFRLGVGYSFNQASGLESDLATPHRKGNSLNLTALYTASNWRIGYSYLDDKRDAAAVAAGFVQAQNWKGNRLYGDIKFGDFTVGLNWDKNDVTAVNGTVAGANFTTVSTKLSSRTAWSLPVKYQTGKHIVTGLYSSANNDTAITDYTNAALGGGVLVGQDNSAKYWSLSYAYLFSARTSVGVGYAVVKNAANGTYTLAGETGAGAAGTTATGYNTSNSGAYMGEKQTYLGVSLRQTF